MDQQSDRRQHDRLRLRLPVQCVLADDPDARVHDGVTVDLSPRGIYFETRSGSIRRGATVRFDLTVPPGEGHSPYQGRVRGAGQVLRVDERTTAASGAEPRSFGIAAQFCEPLECLF